MSRSMIRQSDHLKRQKYCLVYSCLERVGAEDSYLPHTHQNKRKYTPQGQNYITTFPALIFYFHIHRVQRWFKSALLLSYGDSNVLYSVGAIIQNLSSSNRFFLNLLSKIFKSKIHQTWFMLHSARKHDRSIREAEQDFPVGRNIMGKMWTNSLCVSFKVPEMQALYFTKWDKALLRHQLTSCL